MPGREQVGSGDAEPVAEHPLVVAMRRAPAGAGVGSSVRRGLLYAGGARVVLQLLALGSMVLLARLLSPEDYGLYAIAVAISGFASVFIDMGFAASVVQARSLNEEFLATAFWSNLTMAVATAAVVAALAVPLSAFFDAPDLTGLVLVSALTMLLSCNAVNVALIRRSLRFDIEATIAAAAALASILVTVGAALWGAGAYSLVLGPVAERVVNLVMSVVRVRWWPTTGPRREEFSRMWSFSGALTGFTILNYWARNLDRLVIGKVVDVASLGLYNRAYNLMNLPTSQISDVLARIFFPAFSAIADDRQRLVAAWLRVIRASALFGLPVGMAIVVSADPVVAALFGPTWKGVAPILGVLAAAIPFIVLGITVNPIYQAIGRTGLQFRNGILTSTISVAAMLIGALTGGVMGIAWALLVRAPLTLSINAAPLLRELGLRWSQVLLPLWRAITAAGVTAAATFASVQLTTGMSEWWRLAVILTVSTGSWLVMSFLLERDLLDDLSGGRLSRRTASVRRQGAET